MRRLRSLGCCANGRDTNKVRPARADGQEPMRENKPRMDTGDAAKDGYTVLDRQRHFEQERAEYGRPMGDDDGDDDMLY